MFLFPFLHVLGLWVVFFLHKALAVRLVKLCVCRLSLNEISITVSRRRRGKKTVKDSVYCRQIMAYSSL